MKKSLPSPKAPRSGVPSRGKRDPPPLGAAYSSYATLRNVVCLSMRGLTLFLGGPSDKCNKLIALRSIAGGSALVNKADRPEPRNGFVRSSTILFLKAYHVPVELRVECRYPGIKRGWRSASRQPDVRSDMETARICTLQRKKGT